MLPVDNIESFLNQQIFGGGAGGSNVKSIQRGEYSVQTNDTTINISISEVDLDCAIARFMGVTNGYGSPDKDLFTAKLTSPTNLRLTRGGSGYTATVAWEIVEFNNVKSVQRGSITASSTLNISIGAVDIAKSLVIFDAYTTGTSASLFGESTRQVVLTSSTNLRILSHITSTLSTLEWKVIEFK